MNHLKTAAIATVALGMAARILWEKHNGNARAANGMKTVITVTVFLYLHLKQQLQRDIECAVIVTDAFKRAYANRETHLINALMVTAFTLGIVASKVDRLSVAFEDAQSRFFYSCGMMAALVRPFVNLASGRIHA